MPAMNVIPFGASGSFRWIYKVTVLLFAALCAYRSALLLSPGPGFALTALLFALTLLVFFLLGRFVFKEKREGEFTTEVLAASFFCLYGMRLYVPAEKSLLWLVIYGLLVFFVRHALRRPCGKNTRCGAAGLGILFAIFVFLGFQLENYERLEMLYILDEPLALLGMLLSFGGQALLLTLGLNTVFSGILDSDYSAEVKEMSTRKKVLTVASLTAGIFICYLPYFYAFYPGNLSPDSFYELRMQLGIEALSNHHPYIHQLLIKLALMLGGGSLELGVGLYSLVQMLLLSLAFGVCVYFMGRMGVNRYIQLGAFCFFALFSVNGFYSVTMWKDVLYGAISLGFMMVLLVQAKEGKKKNLLFTALLVIFAFLFCVFRNNGWYAFLLGFPLFILCNRRDWKKLSAVFLLVILLVSGYNRVIFDVMGLKKSATGEALSVPLQQIARTVSQNPEELGDEDFTVLREVFADLDSLGELYHPHISDPVKSREVFLVDVFDQDPAKYLKSWAKIGIKHPVSYVEAFLLQCYGYWYPDVSYWIVHNDIEDNELGLEMIEERNNARFELSMLTRDISQQRPTAILYSLGLMVWLMMIAAVLLWLKGQGKLASPIFILAGLWLTTMASPVYCEYRYMYGFVVCVPLFLGLALGVKTVRK